MINFCDKIQIEKYILTTMTDKKDDLDKIGRLIARRINLNYFGEKTHLFSRYKIL